MKLNKKISKIITDSITEPESNSLNGYCSVVERKLIESGFKNVSVTAQPNSDKDTKICLKFTKNNKEIDVLYVKLGWRTC